MAQAASLNSRARVLAAAERRRADRPASSLRCTPEAWSALAGALGVQTPNQVLDRLDIDLRWIAGLPFIGPPERATPQLGGEGADFWGCRWRAAGNDFNTYYELCESPLAGARTVADVDNYAWPSLDWWDYASLPATIAETNQDSPHAVIFWAGGAFETPWQLRGFEQFLVDLRLNPEIAEAISDHVSDYYYQRALRARDAARGGIDMVGSGGDVGSQTGMLLNPAAWRRHIKRYQARLIAPFKQMGLKTFYHSCGSLVPVIPDLIEMGVDILDPIQVTATGMRPEQLFPTFGDRLSFHGAIDEVDLLPRATAAQVYAETIRTIDILGQRGGYIVSPSHQVQGDTPVENILALFEAARHYCWA
jgi:uroporphyrinogen decarboxylase